MVGDLKSSVAGGCRSFLDGETASNELTLDEQHALASQSSVKVLKQVGILKRGPDESVRLFLIHDRPEYSSQSHRPAR